MQALHERVAIVSGAASGIGRAVVARFARAGARVTALDKDAEGLTKLASEFESVTAFPCDVTEKRIGPVSGLPEANR